jgi:hypothetical protein
MVESFVYSLHNQIELIYLELVCAWNIMKLQFLQIANVHFTMI